MAKTKTKIIQLPVEDINLVGLMNLEVYRIRLKALMEEFDLLKEYLDVKYKHALDLAVNQTEKEQINEQYLKKKAQIKEVLKKRSIYLEAYKEHGTLFEELLKDYDVK